LAAIPLAAFEAYGMLIVFKNQGFITGLSLPLLISSIVTITAGSMFLMWIGEIISEQKMGNGISLLIFAGIVAQLPANMYQLLATWDVSRVFYYALFIALSVAIIAGVVVITEARRNIPVSYAKRMRGMKMYGGVSTYLPLSVNPAGVIPIIFAMSILMFPSMIASYFGTFGGWIGATALQIGILFTNVWVHGILYFVMVVLFTYFYTAVTFDPKTISENLQRMGGFIPARQVNSRVYKTHLKQGLVHRCHIFGIDCCAADSRRRHHRSHQLYIFGRRHIIAYRRKRGSGNSQANQLAA
jgi:preprotein translocase subunit SecY